MKQINNQQVAVLSDYWIKMIFCSLISGLPRQQALAAPGQHREDRRHQNYESRNQSSS